jgi:hypothetical protein
MNGGYSIYIYSVTGSTPDVEDGNISGNYVRGVVNSSVYTSFSIIIGDGLGPLLSKPKPDGAKPDFIEVYRELRNQR